jgi:(1->4)-alpha-D-glucan 1-alpha-D-glucosylmutase
VIWRALELRNRLRAVFDKGPYDPLPAFGSCKEHVCAFARSFERFGCIVAAPRLIASLVRGNQVAPTGEDIWRDTILPLPASKLHDRFRNAFTQDILQVQEQNGVRFLRLSGVLNRFPVALLEKIGPQI